MVKVVWTVSKGGADRIAELSNKENILTVVSHHRLMPREMAAQDIIF